MKPNETQKRTIQLKNDVRDILNTFTIETGLNVINVEIQSAIRNYADGYQLIEELSIEVKI
jgi:hypothetical protein